ncbi:hypothetical protein SAMN05421823_103138 [Catalinimonas alkaloidigena]|uniref:Uncharacterized protein n=1 Tax=Catalinimonas alkaloidigena TaxID=1075417 RepID=A0A1G9DI27_9BACT|nr:hypothetical protein SAMN05421823_103138 [Catalinimonas alkaloidigena]
MLVSIPASLGKLGTCLWLLIRGTKTAAMKKRVIVL